ncbi:MAG: LysR family transcriptional regulator [Archangium sp.]|nr:LysR family transcriptional regulator [Archangium sp.]
MDLNHLKAFVTLYETGSFSLAAKRLGVPRSTVSRAIASLESALGARLFHRTTRQVSVSTSGRSLYDQAAARLKALEDALREMPEREEEPSGRLRITATIDLGAAVLAEAAVRFTARYPHVRVETHLNNDVVNLVRDGFDLALRISGRSLKDSSLVASRVGTIRIQLYAAPAYLARAGTPRTPNELKTHDWVGFHAQSRIWLASPLAASAVDTRARLTGDDMFFVRAALLAGGGVGALPTFVAGEDVATGRLVRVLPKWVAQTGGAYLVTPARANTPKKVTAFRELLVAMLRTRPFD